MNENISYITDNSIPSIRNLNQTEIHFLTLRTYVISHITYSEDARAMRSAEEKLREYEQLMAQEQKTIQSIMADYENKFISDDEDRQLNQKVKDAMSHYNEQAKKSSIYRQRMKQKKHVANSRTYRKQVKKLPQPCKQISSTTANLPLKIK